MDTNEQALVQVAAAPLAAPSAAVAGLVAASIAPNTKRTYAAALKRLDAALEGQDLTDASLSIYLASLHAAGLSPAVASMAVASVKFRCRLQALASPVGPATDRCWPACDGKARAGAGPGRRGALQPSRRRGRRRRKRRRVRRRPPRRRLLAVASDGLLRVSEVAALDVGDVQAEADGSGRLLVGESKTDQEGQGAVLYLGALTSPGSALGSRQPATRTGRCFAAFEGAAASKAIQGAGCRSTPSAVSFAAGRPLSASRAGYFDDGIRPTSPDAPLGRSMAGPCRCA